MNRYWATTPLSISGIVSSVCARLLCYFGLLAAASLYAQAQSDGLVDISGRVIDKTTGASLTSGWVIATPQVGEPDPVRYPSVAARIRSDGTFVIYGAPRRKYWMKAQSPGYSLFTGPNTRQKGISVDATPGEDIRDVLLQLIRFGSISGTVTDEEGIPLRGVHVTIVPMSRDGSEPTNASYGVPSVVSDDLGQFRLAALPPGGYLIKAHRRNVLDEDQLFQNVVDHTNRDHPIRMEERLDTAYFPNASRMSDATPVQILPGEEKSGITVAFPAERTYRISGRVSSTRGRLEPGHITIRAFGKQPEGIADSYYANSASDGTFVSVPLPAGSYTLVACGNTHLPGPVHCGSALVIVTGAVRDLAIELQEPVRVNLRLTTPSASSNLAPPFTRYLKTFNQLPPLSFRPAVDHGNHFGGYGYRNL